MDEDPQSPTLTAALLASQVVPVAVVERNGAVESVHHGLVVALDADGEVAWAAGDPEAVIHPRSALKPLQAAAMVAAGLHLEDRPAGRRLRQPRRPSRAPRGGRGHPHRGGARRRRPREHADSAAGPRRPDRRHPGRAVAGLDHAELQRQACRDARHGDRQRVADRRLHRRRPPGPGDHPRACAGVGRCRPPGRHRRLRRAGTDRVVARSGPTRCGPWPSTAIPPTGRWSVIQRWSGGRPATSPS